MVKLTTSKILQAGDGLYSDGTVKGLYLRVRGNTRVWILRRAVRGKRFEIGLGSASAIILTSARKLALKYISLNAEDFLAAIKPKTNSRSYTFGEAVEGYKKWMYESGKLLKGSCNAEMYEKIIRTYLLPCLGAIKLQDLTHKDIAAMVAHADICTSYMFRIINIARTIFAWAIAQEWISERPNPADSKGPLQFILPTKHEIKKRGALSVEEMPLFFALLLQQTPCVSRDCFIFSILTATRSLTARKASWEQIDFKKKIWTIPATQLKVQNNGGLIVPLAPEVIQFLLRLGPQKKGLIFTRTGNPLMPKTFWSYLENLDHRYPGQWRDRHQSTTYEKDIKLTQHGIARATFRTWAQDDRLGNDKRFSARTAELCLHHKVTDAYNGAYERNDSFLRRREMMEAWAKYCYSAAEAEKQVGTTEGKG